MANAYDEWETVVPLEFIFWFDLVVSYTANKQGEHPHLLTGSIGNLSLLEIKAADESLYLFDDMLQKKAKAILENIPSEEI